MITTGHSFSLRRVALLVSLLAAAAFHPQLAAAAQPTEWIAAEVSGQASQQGADGSWHPVTSGAVLVLGMPVKTGPDGRLVVTHDNDRLTVSPGSEFVIPQNADAATAPSILQRLGTLLFKIEHTPDRRFEVKAPYLAAVVKGTVFTVSAGGADDKVHVAEGAVEVVASVSHDLVLLRPGQTAVVSSAGRDLSVLGRHGSAADPRHGATAEARVIEANAAGETAGTPRITQPLGDLHPNIADLSNGLVADGAVSRATGNVRHAALESDVGTASDASTPSAGSSDAAPSNGNAANANAGGGNPNASGGNANAGGGNPNAAGGNANAAGGNPNAAGGNPNAAGGNPNAAGGNPNAAGGNPNAAGGNPNAAGGNPNAGGANGVGNSNAPGNPSIATASATSSGGKGKGKVK